MLDKMMKKLEETQAEMEERLQGVKQLKTEVDQMMQNTKVHIVCGQRDVGMGGHWNEEAHFDLDTAKDRAAHYNRNNREDNVTYHVETFDVVPPKEKVQG